MLHGATREARSFFSNPIRLISSLRRDAICSRNDGSHMFLLTGKPHLRILEIPTQFLDRRSRLLKIGRWEFVSEYDPGRGLTSFELFFRFLTPNSAPACVLAIISRPVRVIPRSASL